MLEMPQRPPRRRRLALRFREHLLPIFIFGPVMAILCWGAAWFFRERQNFSDAFLGLGAFAIVIPFCAYLFVLVNRAESGE
jgi:hypothetical protein